MNESIPPRLYIEHNIDLWANSKRKYLTMQELADRYIIIEIHTRLDFIKFYKRANIIFGLDNWYMMSRTLVLNSHEELTIFAIEFNGKLTYDVVNKTMERYLGDY